MRGTKETECCDEGFGSFPMSIGERRNGVMGELLTDEGRL